MLQFLAHDRSQLEQVVLVVQILFVSAVRKQLQRVEVLGIRRSLQLDAYSC